MLRSNLHQLIQSQGYLSLIPSKYCSRKLTGLVLTGYYENDQSDTLKLSECAQRFDSLVSSRLSQLASISKIEKSRTFYGLHEDYPAVALSIIKKIKDEPNSKMKLYDIASRDVKSEAVRSAIGTGLTTLKLDKDIKKIEVDSADHAKAASESAHLALYVFDALRSKKEKPPLVTQCNFNSLSGKNEKDWNSGKISALCQNFARYLMESPANHMTPKLFVEAMQNKIDSECRGKIKAVVRDSAWITEQNMGSFLSVAKGSVEPPYFLELHYKGSDSPPVCLVGKGVTFDSGGISIKPSKGMESMRADMGGAACVAAATLGAAALNIPLNLITLIPLCENMPSHCATKPGDVVTAMNGTTIQVDNTDAEGRLILADALCYADTFNPCHVIDVATLTGAIAVSLGGECVGAYSTCDHLWKTLEQGGYISGDRLWRMPLFQEYHDLLQSRTADINNISSSPYGGSITAAKFLQNFVKCSSWAHLDIAGVMDDTTSMSYLCKGMSGRPTRSIIEALKKLSQSN